MKARFVALAVATTLGLGSVSAFAQDYHHHEGRQGQWQQQRGNWGRGQWADNHRYAYPRYDTRSYGYRHNDGDLAGALVLGALAGAVVGQAANPYAYSQPPAYYAPPAQYYAPPAYYSAPPAYYSTPNYGYYGN